MPIKNPIKKTEQEDPFISALKEAASKVADMPTALRKHLEDFLANPSAEEAEAVTIMMACHLAAAKPLTSLRDMASNRQSDSLMIHKRLDIPESSK